MGLMRFSLLGCLLLSSSGFAAEWKFSLNGETEVTGLHWQNKVAPDNRQNRVYLNQKLPTTLKYGRTWRLRLQPIALYDPSNASKSERFFFDMQEGYLQYQALPWTVQLGNNVFTWGDTDVFNPLDVVNQRRYFDPFQSEKLGAPALMIKRDFESFFVETIYIPKQRQTILPGEKSRWLPRNLYRSRSFKVPYQGKTYTATVNIPANLNYHYMRPEEREKALDNNFGARFKFRFPGFDWTLAGFQGAAPTPAVNIKELGLISQVVLTSPTEATVTLEEPDIHVRATYYQSRMAGTSFTLVAGNFLFKGASAYSSPTKPAADLPAKALENALGVERTFGVGKGSLTMLAQGTYVKRGDRVDPNSISLARMFDRGAMGALRWAPSEKFTFLASYLRDIRYKGSLVHSDASYKLADGWKAKLGLDLLAGQPETPIGTYERNDRLTFSLNSQW